MEPIIQPSLKELEERISEIENIDLAFLSIDDIKSRLKLLFTGYTVDTISFNIGFLFYRGIKYDVKPTLFSYLSYPPADITKMGRANRVGFPVFYCATDKNVPFYELYMQPGDRFVISEWRVQKDLLVNNVGYTESVFADLNSNRIVPNFDISGKLDDRILNEKNVLVQNYFAKKFSQKVSENDSYIYKFTNAIAEKHFSENDAPEYAEFKGLMYPTIRMGANADNLAITQLAVDNGYIQFDKVEFVEVLEVKDNVYSYKILDVAFRINSDIIEWKNLNYHWVTDSINQLYLVEEANQVFAYDCQGELIKANENNA